MVNIVFIRAIVKIELLKQKKYSYKIKAIAIKNTSGRMSI